MKISVVIPVYNAEKYLSRCLDSVINQTYDNWEVIAIDDGSQDSSYTILSQYSLNDKRFKVFSQKNQGPGYTRNIAISKAIGDYIVFLDADDYINFDYFSDLIDCVEENKSDVVFIDLVQEKVSGELIRFEKMSKYKALPKDKIIRYQMTGKMPWGGVRKAVRTSLILDNKIEYSKDIVGEEALFSFRILTEANNISFLDKKTYYHYVNYPNSQSKKGKDDPWGPICSKLSDYLQENNLFNEYQSTINSFGFTALIVSIYRISQNHNFTEAMLLSKRALQIFKSKYNFKLDEDSLELRTKCVTPFAKAGLVFPILLAAKIKSTL